MIKITVTTLALGALAAPTAFGLFDGYYDFETTGVASAFDGDGQRSFGNWKR